MHVFLVILLCTNMRMQAMLQPFYEKLSPEDRMLLQEAIRAKDREHKPFFDAITQGDQAAVEQQTASGIDLQYIDEFGRNALSHARTAAMFAYLLKKKVRLVIPQMADVAPEEERAQIAALKQGVVHPLIQAVESGDIRKTENELKRDLIDISCVDTMMGCSLLSYAKTASMQQILMRHGAGAMSTQLGTARREIEDLLSCHIAQECTGVGPQKVKPQKARLSVPQYIAQLDTPHCSAILARVLSAYLPAAPDGEPLESKKEE